MCTVWAALFLFLPLSVSVPLFHPPRLRRSLSSPNPPCPPTQLRFVCLSRSSSSLSVASRPPSLPRSAFRSSFPTLSVSVYPPPVLPFPPHSPPPATAASAPPRSLSLVISSSSARSRFFSRSFHRPPIFPLPRACVCRPPPPSASPSPSDPAPLPGSPRSIFPPRAALYIPSVETARFFPPVSSAPAFFTPFFSPRSSGCPCAAPPPLGIPPRASVPSPFRPRLTYVRDLLPSIPRPSIPRPFPPLAFVHLSPCHLLSPPPAPSFHFSLPPRTLAPAPIFLIFFFTTTRPPTDAARRRRPFSIGTLFSTIGSATYSRIHVRARARAHVHARRQACTQTRTAPRERGRERERRDKEGRKKGVGMWEEKESRGGCTRRAADGRMGGVERARAGGGGETGCSAWMRAKMYFFSSFLYIFPSSEPW